MTQQTLTKAEVAKVFALYYRCRLHISRGDIVTTPTVLGANVHNDGLLLVYTSEANYSFDNWEIKLLLTPLDLITDEDAIKVAKMDWGNIPYHTVEQGRGLVLDYAEFLGWDVYQFLISKSYAVPLWFGLHHWANGKTAIELEIAKEK